MYIFFLFLLYVKEQSNVTLHREAECIKLRATDVTQVGDAIHNIVSHGLCSGLCVIKSPLTSKKRGLLINWKTQIDVSGTHRQVHHFEEPTRLVTKTAPWLVSGKNHPSQSGSNGKLNPNLEKRLEFKKPSLLDL